MNPESINETSTVTPDHVVNPTPNLNLATAGQRASALILDSIFATLSLCIFCLLFF